MKRIFFIVSIFLLGNPTSRAQITYVDTTQHLTLSGYLGVLTGPELRIKTGTGKPAPGYHLSFRAGGIAKWEPKKWFGLSGFGGAEITPENVTPFYTLSLNFTPAKRFTLHLGRIVTPIAMLRPNPISADGQFEWWIQSQLPGAAFGGRANITLSEKNKLSLCAGGFYRNDSTATIETHLLSKHLNGGIWYTIQTKKIGIAVTVVRELISATLVYRQDELVGWVIVLNIPKTNGLSLYSDMGFSLNQQRSFPDLTPEGNLIKGEWGVTKSYSTKWIKGLFRLGYAHEITSFRGYFMINI